MKNFVKKLSNKVRIVEVGLRDGLQNEKYIVPLNVKIELLKRLSNSGLKSIEVGSFVSPKWVPQMENTDKLCKYIKHQQRKTGSKRLNTTGISHSVLTPNIHGLNQAIKNGGINEIAIFGAASEEFSKNNINCSIEESMERFKPVVKKALINGFRVRGYVSCVLGCPFEGVVDPKKVAMVAKNMLSMGCYEVSLGDTIGVGTINTTRDLLEYLIKQENISPDLLAGHFHGIRVFDTSISGLGGCPYAGNAVSGNVATEDVIHMFNESGIETDVDIEKLLIASKYIDEVLGRQSSSRFAVNKLI